VRSGRIVALLIAIALAVLVAPGAAHAEPYPAETPPASVSDGTVSDGGSVTFSGTGFLPFEKISIDIGYAGSDSSAALGPHPAGGYVLAAARQLRRATLTVTADAQGSFSITLRLTETGTATLVATGLTSGRKVTANVEVLGPSDGDDNGVTPGDGNGSDREVALPTTGPSAAPLLASVIGGLSLVIVGGLVVRYARSRRSATGR
jgi:hypothetical protein